jgi:hypothetical protein
MSYKAKVTVCSEIHTKHINTLCGQKVEFRNVKHDGTYSNLWVYFCRPLLPTPVSRFSVEDLWALKG